MVLGGHHVALVLVEARVREHADLVGDVVPVALGARGGDGVAEQRAHLVDAPSHGGDLAQPLLVQLVVGEHARDDARAVQGRVGVDGASDNLDLGEDAGGLVGVLADNRELADAVAVQTKVLGEGLKRITMQGHEKEPCVLF